ncbi:MAG TPA: hypothetical protein VG274_04440 [Rhizomicrobium sp.]|nr:hypothetical protein [Rhizomicrobium sp.]
MVGLNPTTWRALDFVDFVLLVVILFPGEPALSQAGGWWLPLVRMRPMHRDYTREALLAAAESPHDPYCLTKKHHVPTDGLCTCHIGKARFALEIGSMSFAENAQLVADELLPAEKSGPVEGYDVAYRRALVKRTKKMAIKLD